MQKQVLHRRFQLVGPLKALSKLDIAFDEACKEATKLLEKERHWIPFLTVHAMKRTRLIPLDLGQTIESLPQIFSGKPLEDARKEIAHRDTLKARRDRTHLEAAKEERLKVKVRDVNFIRRVG